MVLLYPFHPRLCTPSRTFSTVTRMTQECQALVTPIGYLKALPGSFWMTEDLGRSTIQPGIDVPSSLCFERVSITRVTLAEDRFTFKMKEADRSCPTATIACGRHNLAVIFIDLHGVALSKKFVMMLDQRPSVAQKVFQTPESSLDEGRIITSQLVLVNWTAAGNFLSS